MLSLEKTESWPAGEEEPPIAPPKPGIDVPMGNT